MNHSFYLNHIAFNNSQELLKNNMLKGWGSIAQKRDMAG
jgi:hypothetical protein